MFRTTDPLHINWEVTKYMVGMGSVYVRDGSELKWSMFMEIEWETLREKGDSEIIVINIELY